MNNIETYIDKEKFQFITSFEKIEIENPKGEDIILDFGKLTIDERVFLSAYLTYITQNGDINKEEKSKNLYDIVFNFNDNKKNKTSFHDAFITTISECLRTKLLFVLYINKHYNEIKDGKTTIYRTQLNRSEMDALYSLKFQRSYKSLCNVLYIIGVAKSKFRTQLNKISIDRFYNNSSMSKNRIKEIMEKLSIGYEIVNDNVYFGNGFNIELAEKYTSEAKKNFEKEIDELDIINNIPVINKSAEVKEIKKEVKEKVVEHVEPAKPIKEEKQDYLYEQIKKSEKQNIPEKDLSAEELDDLFATADAMSGRTSIIEDIPEITSIDYKMKWQKHKDNIGITAAMKLVQEWDKTFNYNAELEKIQKKFNVKSEIIDNALNDGYFDDKDGGLNMKKNILASFKELRNQLNLMVNTENVFGNDKDIFMGYMYKTHDRFMALTEKI